MVFSTYNSTCDTKSCFCVSAGYGFCDKLSATILTTKIEKIKMHCSNLILVIPTRSTLQNLERRVQDGGVGRCAPKCTCKQLLLFFMRNHLRFIPTSWNVIITSFFFMFSFSSCLSFGSSPCNKRRWRELKYGRPFSPICKWNAIKTKAFLEKNNLINLIFCDQAKNRKAK